MELNSARPRLEKVLSRIVCAFLMFSSLAVGCHYPLMLRDEGRAGLPRLEPDEKLASQGLVKTIAFSSGGQTLVVGGELMNTSHESDSRSRGFVQVWDLANSSRQNWIVAYPRSVTALAVSPNGKEWIAGDAEGRLIISSVPSKPIARPFHQKSEITTLVFSPDGKWVASGSLDSSFPLGFMDVATGGMVKVKLQFGPVSALAFSPDGNDLAVGTTKGQLVVWNYASSSLPKQVSANGSEKGAITSIAFSSSGGHLLAYGRRDGTTVILDRRTEQTLGDLNVGSAVSSLAFSPDNRYLAVAQESGKVVVLESHEGQPIWSKRHVLPVTDLAYSPDGLALAVASQRHVYLYRVNGAASSLLSEVGPQ